MQAVAIHEFGGPDVLHVENMAPPTPREYECLLKVHATSVNPVDYTLAYISISR